MSDLVLRRAETRWRVDGETGAQAYLVELERRGLLPDLSPVERVWGDWEKVAFNGRRQSNAHVRTAADGVQQLRSYADTVATYYPALSLMVYSPDRAYSPTSGRHVTRWGRELGAHVREEIVSAETVDRA